MAAQPQQKPLSGKIAVVAGATRGAGRGIACMLGEAGATVYCTGRSSRSNPRPVPKPDKPFDLAHRPETIEETAEMVTRFGGKGIAVRVDHMDQAQVIALFERVRAEQGRLDILINDIWGGDQYLEFDKPFWELLIENSLQMIQQSIFTHLITSRYGVPLMIGHPGGLVVEVTDGDQPGYRGNLPYDLVKSSMIRMAMGMAEELRPHKIAAVAVTPGFLRSEAMLEHFGVTEANWQEGTRKDPHYIASETPFYVGRAVAALAADPAVMTKTGGVYASWTLHDEYGFVDMDGRAPHWGRYFAENIQGKQPQVT